MGGPESAKEWIGAINMLHTYLGIQRNKFAEYITDIFVDVKNTYMNWEKCGGIF